MSTRTPDFAGADVPDDTPEFPLSGPIKPDDPERRRPQSRAETEGCVEEQNPAQAPRQP